MTVIQARDWNHFRGRIFLNLNGACPEEPGYYAPRGQPSPQRDNRHAPDVKQFTYESCRRVYQTARTPLAGGTDAVIRSSEPKQQ
jgi:hypothetical protein